MSELEEFRADVRAWLEENCPESMRTPMPDDETVWGGRRATYKNPDSKLWLERMVEKGWTVPAWPKEYGGGGLSAKEARVLEQELRRLNCRPALQSFGIWMLGPALLEFATEEQKLKYLPPIARGEIRWCQGYSEPNAGSDLASLQTSAVEDGDHFIVNGQKVWTSYADKADWIFCLVRTDKSTKHDGISFLLFDMESEGVSARPIRLISGASPFCETFFDNVRVPKDQLVGPRNGGWTIAKRLLQHERQMISGFGLGGALSGDSASRSMEALAKKYVGEEEGRVADPVLRDAIARHKMKGRAFALTTRRAAEEAKAGGMGAASSMFKYYGTEHNKNRFELMLKVMGSAALGWEGEGFTPAELSITRQWLRSKGNSIEGGTSEIQLNVIAKRVLGLPD
ncbi:MAG: acyl-CoA dehydrogenase family protein [Chrysiogenetes bacterium]|nr:acyl-CoA dehydrogenase family protein [Chrysiogenetes bacterium]